jgi:hypothetical protein
MSIKQTSALVLAAKQGVTVDELIERNIESGFADLNPVVNNICFDHAMGESIFEIAKKYSLTRSEVSTALGSHLAKACVSFHRKEMQEEAIIDAQMIENLRLHTLSRTMGHVAVMKYDRDGQEYESFEGNDAVTRGILNDMEKAITPAGEKGVGVAVQINVGRDSYNPNIFGFGGDD